MKRKVMFLALIMSALYAGTLSKPASVQAEAITVTPIFQELMMTANTKTETGSFSITNQGDTPQTYRLRAVNIETADTSGGILFSGLSADFESDHGLIQWLQFDQQTVTIGPTETKEIPFTISNNDSLKPGGHYGALIAQSITNADTDSANKVALSPQAASLVFVKKIGGEQYGLNASTIRLPTSWFSPPRTAQLVMENTGDVHVIPRGAVVVEDMFGRDVLRGAINADSVLILPGKKRELTVDLRSVRGGLRWPGRYQATVTFRFDGKEDFETVKLTIWLVNVWTLFGIIATLALTITLIYRFRVKINKILVSSKTYILKKSKLVKKLTKVMNRLVVKKPKN